MMISRPMRWMALAIVLIAAVAHAQPSSAFLSEFQAGTDAYRLGQYDQARAHLERAMAIDPSLPGPPRFLAAVDAAERKWDDCVAHARTAIVANPLSSEIGATRKLHDDCRAALDRPAFTGDYADGGALYVHTNIAGAEISISGLRAGASPLAPRAIALGTVEVSAEKAGWKSARGTATIIPGVVTDVELVLEEAPTSLDIAPDPGLPTDGWVRVDAPPDATVTFDDRAYGFDDRLRYTLPIGEYDLVVTAPGYLPYRKRIRVERGQELTIAVPRTSRDAHARRRRYGAIALGTAAGLGAIGAVTGWLALDAADTARDWAAIERARPPGLPLDQTTSIAPLHTRADIEAKGDRARTLGLVSGISYVASAAALAAGVYLLVRAPAETAVEIAPSIGDGWGVTVRGALP